MPTVVGGQLAALVAAERLAAAGEPVRLLLPERGVGGGLAPICRDGRRLELGVRLLELAYEGEPATPPPLREYAPGPAGHRLFQPLVRKWVTDFAGDALTEVGHPRMVIGGRIVDDLHFATDPLAVRALGEPACTRIHAEAREICARLGDRGVLGAEADLDLVEASLAQHGPTFHEHFVAPLIDKVTGDVPGMLPELRRKLWVAFFWPRTLAEATNGARPSFRPDRRFHTLSPGGAGALLERLLDHLDRDPLVDVMRVGRLVHAGAAAGGRTFLQFEGGWEERALRPILAAGPEEMFAAAGVPVELDRARAAIAWAEVDEAALSEIPSVLTVLDPDIPAHRISTGSTTPAAGRRVLAVELRHDLDRTALATAAHDSLVACGLVAETTPVDIVSEAAAPSFPLPTRVNADRHARGLAPLLRLDATIAGGATAFGADTVNEQIIQGLWAAETYS